MYEKTKSARASKQAGDMQSVGISGSLNRSPEGGASGNFQCMYSSRKTPEWEKRKNREHDTTTKKKR